MKTYWGSGRIAPPPHYMDVSVPFLTKIQIADFHAKLEGFYSDEDSSRYLLCCHTV
jgi:hypothetical protein